jgi:hypothetical protein
MTHQTLADWYDLDNPFHVYPVNDLRDHITDGGKCWCNPSVKDNVVIHNSMDERESYEQGRKPQ